MNLNFNWNGEKILKRDTSFKKAISVQESLALILHFLASGDLYISLQYLFKISKQQLTATFQKCVKLLLKN
jgi:flagellin-specific chaperone FliS